MNLTAVAVSLLAALAFGWSSAAMHRGASSTPEGSSAITGLLQHVLRSPLWVSGLVASLTGLGLHAVALDKGSIAVVQPVVVQSLLFSLLFRAAFEHRALPPAVLRWSAVSTVGLAVLIASSRSSDGTSAPDDRAALVVLVIALAGAATCWRLAGHAAGGAEGALLGSAVGVLFGLTAGALKATVGSGGVTGALTHPGLYVLVVVGVGGQFLNQVVYRRTALQASLPAVNTVNPVVALVVGAVVFDERPMGSTLSVVTALLGLVITLVGLSRLARLDTSAAVAR